MNNLLDRMILRTQRALSSAEPLVVPAYAERGALGSVDVDSSVLSVITSVQPASQEIPGNRAGKSRDLPTLGHPSVRNEQQERRDPAPHPSAPSPQAHTQSTAPQFDLPSLTSTPVTPGKADDLPQPLPRPENHASFEAIQLGSPPSRDLVIAHRHANSMGNESESSAKPQDRPQPASPIEVSISIGHIEVRAVQKSRPTQKAAPLPRVTLDDYLHRRTKGSR